MERPPVLFGFCLKTGNYTVERIHYAPFTVNFAKMHRRCTLNPPCRPLASSSKNGRSRVRIHRGNGENGEMDSEWTVGWEGGGLLRL